MALNCCGSSLPLGLCLRNSACFLRRVGTSYLARYCIGGTSTGGLVRRLKVLNQLPNIIFPYPYPYRFPFPYHLF